MNNNDLLRRLRYLFHLNELQIVALFKLAGHEVTETQVTDWLEKEEESSSKEMTDKEMAIFLNGLIIEKRGRREGSLPVPEEQLTNNIILRKLRIALNLKSDDILDLFASINKDISKHELSAFFRNPGNRSYQPMLDQYLRNFLNALQAKSKDKPGSIT